MTTVDADTVTEDTISEGGASRPLRKDALRNRQALVTAAREVFAERGLDASLDDIARRAGVGVGTAYRHFANKHELARAIFTEAIDDIVALAEQAAVAPDPWDGILHFIVGTAEAQSADRGLHDVIMGAHDAEAMEEINQRLSGPLTTLLARAKAAGVLRADAESTDFGIILIMLTTVSTLTADSAPELWRRYLPILVDGLRPGRALPEPAIGEEDLRAAMAHHKQRLYRSPCAPDA